MRGRFDPHVLRAKVVAADRPSGLVHELRDLIGDVTQIDRVARGHDRGRASSLLVGPLERDEASEERAEIVLRQDLADARRPPVREENLRARRPLPETLGEALDRRGEAGIDREAVAKLDRRSKHFRKREATVACERGQPSIGRSRSDRPRDADRHVVAVGGAIGLQVERRGPMPEAVDRLGRGHARPEHDDRRDPAEIRQVAFEDVKRNARRDAGVDRVTSPLEHPRASEGRQVMT
jgi:hypothetical protein